MDTAVQTQLANIEKRTGRSLAERAGIRFPTEAG